MSLRPGHGHHHPAAAKRGHPAAGPSVQSSLEANVQPGSRRSGPPSNVRVRNRVAIGHTAKPYAFNGGMKRSNIRKTKLTRRIEGFIVEREDSKNQFLHLKN